MSGWAPDYVLGAISRDRRLERNPKDSKVYCTCKGWQFRKDCKHLAAHRWRQEVKR